MPESTAFRSWVPRRVRAGSDRYVAHVARRYGVPIVDGRDWVGDDLFYYDRNHLLPAGATVFTERFARDALGRLLDGTIRDTATAASRERDATTAAETAPAGG